MRAVWEIVVAPSGRVPVVVTLPVLDAARVVPRSAGLTGAGGVGVPGVTGETGGAGGTGGVTLAVAVDTAVDTGKERRKAALRSLVARLEHDHGARLRGEIH